MHAYAGMDLDLKDDAQDLSDESLVREAVTMMRRNLPEYVVNRFVAAGYDALDIIAEMDVSDKPGNSLQVIEEFIAKEYPNDPQYTRCTMAPSFKFPPGHRQRIAKFVGEVANHVQAKKIPLNHKRRCVEPPHKAKRMKSSWDITSSSASELSPCNQDGMVRDIRQQIAKWQRSQKNNKLRELKEHHHFTIDVKVAESRNSVALVQCKVCGRRCTLGLKNGRTLLSNWTRHIIMCVQSLSRTATEHKLDKHFSTPSPHSWRVTYRYTWCIPCGSLCG